MTQNYINTFGNLYPPGSVFPYPPIFLSRVRPTKKAVPPPFTIKNADKDSFGWGVKVSMMRGKKFVTPQVPQKNNHF